MTVGHPGALVHVERAIDGGRPPHALLLLGPERIGKTTLALDLAAGLLCLAADPADRPCRDCAACRKVDHGNHPDVHRLAPEGAGQQIRVGQVQALAAELALLPLEGRFRIAILEGAHRLNVDAQNALLKTLEEPPPAVVIVLCADDAPALLPTVASRCMRIRMSPVGSEVIGRLLAEAGAADSARGAALGRLAGGRPGIAIALAAQPEATLVQARLAGALLDLLTADRRQRLAAQLALVEDGGALAAAASGSADDPIAAKPDRSRRISPAERRAAVGQVIAVWREVARDLAIAARGGRREIRQHELLDDLVRSAALVEPAAVVRFLGRIEAASRALDAYANPELALDALLLEWPRSRQAA